MRYVDRETELLARELKPTAIYSHAEVDLGEVKTGKR